MKKFFTLFLTLMTSVMLCAYDFQSGDLYYNITSNVAPYTVEVTSGNTKYSGDITIPSSVTYNGITYAVTSIGSYAFRDCSSLTSVAIPNSVTSIRQYAFSNCTSLTSVTIPNSVTTIGSEAFEGCSSLTSVTIPNSVTSIGFAAFRSCYSLTSVTIPSSVTTIGSEAFYYTRIFNDNSNWENGVLYISNCLVDAKESLSGAYAIKNGTRIIGSSAFSYCSSLTSVTIPNSVTSIGSSAFSGCSSLTSVTIPNSVTSIGSYAFSDCSSLTSVSIPSSVMSIGSYAFTSCSSLTSITIPSSVTSIGSNAFYDCVLPKDKFINNSACTSNNNWGATLADKEQDGLLIKDNVVVGCKRDITKVTIPNGIVGIGYQAFYNCSSLTSITIPSSVTSIGYDAFSGCSSLTSITIPNSVTSIESGAFYYCSSLTSVTIPNSVTNIGGSAFSGCSSLTSVTIPNSVTSIGYRAFNGCYALSSITIPNSVTDISGDAFSGCRFSPDDFINHSILNATENNYWGATIADKEQNGLLIKDNVVVGAKRDITTITIPNGIVGIADYAFYKCSSLTSVTIPNSVTSIGSSAFYGCSSLNSITIPNSVTSIESNTFQGCSSLTSVTFFNSVRHIQWEAFKDCINLDDIIIPEHITVICSDAFDNTGISNNASNWEDGVLYIDDCLIDAKESLNGAYTIKDGTRLIARCAFKNCSTLTSFTIPQSVDIIGQLAFEGTGYYNDNANWEDGVLYINDWLICANTSVPNEYIIKDATRMIAEGAFLAKNVVSITLPNSLEGIGTVAFGMTPITSLIIPENVSIIYEKAFGSNITSIELRATTPPTLIATVFTSSPICHIPCGTLDAYEASDWASQVSEFVEDYPYTLTISSSNNSMGSATITQEPACNTPAIITATPNNGYHFVQWSDGNTDNPRTLTVAEDIELTAEFEEDDNQDNGSYSRNVRIGYNTICLPHGAIHFTGATFYEIAHILKNKKKIFFDEVKTLEAGKPYIFYPHSNEVTVYYDNTTSAVPLSHNGLHGTFDGITAASNFLKGKYLVAGDRMVLCGDGCSLAANRAYIELDEISDKDHPAIPGIKRVSMDYSEENATTALDNITDETIVAPMQEGVYDILGRKVDAPTVSGFYIINGKKVFVAL